MRTLLNVYLLTLTSDQRVFYSEMIAPAESPAHTGLRGWAERRLRRLEQRWTHSRGTAARWGRAVWSWLHSRTHPDEPLLGRLRSASAITLHHPASMDADIASDVWAHLLDRGWRRHLPWFIIDTLVAPLTIVLVPLPGPNLIGYWVAYRAIHHLLILAGIRRVRRRHVETTFLSVEALNPSIAIDEPELALAIGCDPSALREFLEHRGVEAAAPATGK